MTTQVGTIYITDGGLCWMDFDGDVPPLAFGYAHDLLATQRWMNGTELDAFRLRVRCTPPHLVPVVCYECGYRATEAQCSRTPEGLECPGCHAQDGMTSALSEAGLYDRRALDVFEMDTDRWYWALNGQYPTGPFATRDEATEDANSTVAFDDVEPPSDIDAAWKADQPFRGEAYETVRRGFEGDLGKTARTR